MSEETALAGVLAAMRAVHPAAYSLGELKAMSALPTAYNEVHVFALLPTNPRADGVSASRRYTVLVRAVAQSYTNAQRMRQKAREALLYRTVTVGSVESGGIGPAQGDDPIAPDDGWFSGTSEFVFSTDAD